MKSRTDFCKQIANLTLSHADRAIALLWYYRQSQEFDERTASELASDLHEEGFPRANVTRLLTDLRRSRFTVRGHRSGTFQLDVRRIPDLDSSYNEILALRKVNVTDQVLPSDFVAGTRAYLEQMVHQINGCYDYGFYDGCAVLCRRLMESLIVEVYMSRSRQHEIQRNGVFVYLDNLITYIRNDPTITLGRSTPKTMEEIKQIGDAAAHDRVYITRQTDIDDVKAKYRRMINDLLVVSGIKT